ncbi:unnamed protein product [Ectocarpus sp. 6 AP-2014]
MFKGSPAKKIKTDSSSSKRKFLAGNPLWPCPSIHCEGLLKQVPKNKGGFFSPRGPIRREGLERPASSPSLRQAPVANQGQRDPRRQEGPQGHRHDCGEGELPAFGAGHRP